MVTAKVGAKAPDFEAPAYYKGEFTTVKLSDFLGKWVPKEKREASKAFTQGTQRIPPMEVLLADSGQKVPIPGVSFG